MLERKILNFQIEANLDFCLLIISQGLGKKIQTVCRRNIEFLASVSYWSPGLLIR